MNTIIFFVGDGAVGKTYLLHSLTDCYASNGYNYVNDTLVIIDGFVEKKPDDILNEMQRVYKHEKYLNKNATFIFVTNRKPNYDYAKLFTDHKFKLITMEDL